MCMHKRPIINSTDSSRRQLFRLLSLVNRNRTDKRDAHSVDNGHISRLLSSLFPEHLAETAPQRRQRGQPLWLPHDTRRPLSPGWDVALQLFQLSKRVNTGNPASQKQHLEWLIRNGRFHPSAWATSVGLLEEWRALETSEETLPPQLGDGALLQLAYGLSCVQGGKTAGHASASNASLSVVQVYQRAAADAHRRPSLVNPRCLSPLRHMVMTTLLKNNQWEKAVEFLQHSLQQRDMPDSVTTGLLFHVLSDAKQWEIALSVFELCAQMLPVAHSILKSDEPKRKKLAQRWGTTLSIGMAEIASLRPALCAAMLNTIVKQQQQQHTALAPIAALDGKFLAAVEHVSSAEERFQILRTAREHRLLDYHRLIRGLCSKQRWIEALAVFHEAARANCFTRREVGQCRGYLLNASDASNVRIVVRHIQKAHPQRGEESLILNDVEVETVLLKSLDVQGPATNSYWQFITAIMDANFPGVVATAATSGGGGQGNNSRNTNGARRVPSVAMLSLLARNQGLPWAQALSLVHQSHHLSLASYVDRGETDVGPKRAALTSAVTELLYRSGVPRVADELAIRSFERDGIPLPKVFLSQCDLSEFQRLLERCSSSSNRERRKVVDNMVLYALLHEPLLSAGAASDAAHGMSRPLRIVSLLMKQHIGSDFTVASQTGKDDPRGAKWMDLFPFSIHSEIIRCLRKDFGLSERERLTYSLNYHNLLFSAFAQAQQGGGTPPPSPARRQELYSVFYEVLLTVVHTDHAHFDTLGSLPSPHPLLEQEHEMKKAVLEGMIRRVIGRLQCRTPTHMWLSNQVDRLLPPLPPSSPSSLSAAEKTIWEAEEDLSTRTYSVFAMRAILHACVKSIRTEISTRGLTDREAPSGVDPATIPCMIKLLCRLSEYELHMPSATSAEPQHDDTHVALQLLQWQLAWFGSGSVRDATVSLLFYLFRNSQNDWKAALQASQLLCDNAKQPSRGKSLTPAVSDDHYRLYASLFGWERALGFWYEQCPQAVLLRVANNSEALNYCFSLGSPP